MVGIAGIITAARLGYKVFKYGYRTGKFVRGNRLARTLAKDGLATGVTGGIFGGSYSGIKFAHDVYKDYRNAKRNQTKVIDSRGSNAPIRGGIW